MALIELRVDKPYKCRYVIGEDKGIIEKNDRLINMNIHHAGYQARKKWEDLTKEEQKENGESSYYVCLARKDQWLKWKEHRLRNEEMTYFIIPMEDIIDSFSIFAISMKDDFDVLYLEDCEPALSKEETEHILQYDAQKAYQFDRKEWLSTSDTYYSLGDILLSIARQIHKEGNENREENKIFGYVCQKEFEIPFGRIKLLKGCMKNTDGKHIHANKEEDKDNGGKYRVDVGEKFVLKDFDFSTHQIQLEILESHRHFILYLTREELEEFFHEMKQIKMAYQFLIKMLHKQFLWADGHKTKTVDIPVSVDGQKERNIPEVLAFFQSAKWLNS